METNNAINKFYRLKVNYKHTLIDNKGKKYIYDNLNSLVSIFEDEDNENKILWEMDPQTPYIFKTVEEIEPLLDEIEKDLTAYNYDSSFMEIESFEIEEVNITPVKTIERNKK